MTINQFITKHSLSPLELTGWRPAVLLMQREGFDDFDDVYEFYTNADRTIWVSINRTHERFRIAYADLLIVYSDWERVGVNYELAPLVTN